ncbi:MAG: IS1 family transposase [Thermodesulfobacteriota bacterium]
MNKLNSKKQEMIVSALIEGSSIRSTERMTGVHRDTIMRLMVKVGDSCKTLMDEKMVNLPCKNIQVDEVWCYVGKKQRHVRRADDKNQCGDFWTWVAIDADSKLVPSFRTGKRDRDMANEFIGDLSLRLANRVQISSDKLKHYVEAIELEFGGNVDYAQIVKSYEAEAIGPGRYSPPKVVSTDKTIIRGNPDMDKVSTSFVERQNLTMRMSMRRFTRLTNAFSKKLDNLKAAIALHFAHYNFVRIHRTLSCTPAMEVGIENRIWSIGDLIEYANSN